MRTRQGYGYWRQSIEKLREKWTAFTTEIIRTITEEEMKIRREEFESLSLMLQNLAGETHTFTRVREFGGGFVAPLADSEPRLEGDDDGIPRDRRTTVPA